MAGIVFWVRLFECLKISSSFGPLVLTLGEIFRKARHSDDGISDDRVSDDSVRASSGDSISDDHISDSVMLCPHPRRGIPQGKTMSVMTASVISDDRIRANSGDVISDGYISDSVMAKTMSVMIMSVYQ
jgi:hypothetical protein